MKAGEEEERARIAERDRCLRVVDDTLRLSDDKWHDLMLRMLNGETPPDWLAEGLEDYKEMEQEDAVELSPSPPVLPQPP